jgi:hypothetical protein
MPYGMVLAIINLTARVFLAHCGGYLKEVCQPGTVTEKDVRFAKSVRGRLIVGYRNLIVEVEGR